MAEVMIKKAQEVDIYDTEEAVKFARECRDFFRQLPPNGKWLTREDLERLEAKSPEFWPCFNLALDELFGSKP